MATSTHNKYVSIPDWFSSSSSTPITSAEKPANITNVYYGGGSGGGTTEIPIDNKTIVWLDLVITVPIDNDKIIINTEGKITTSGTTGVWELRQLTDGTNYIYTTYPVVTQLGITMYAGTDDLDLGSIYDGLPIDNATIYWDLDENGNKILKAVGSSGGVADSVAWANVTGKPDWLLDGIDGKFVTFDLDETIDGIKTFTNGIKIGNSLINQSLNDVIYIDGNLAVRGGITMYATDIIDIPSILDSLPVAGTESKGIASFDSSYFSVTNGKVTLLADNVGLNESELAKYLNTNNYAKKSDIPSLNGYATQSWVESKGYALNSDLISLTTKVDDFLEGSDTDTIINKWLELEAFLSGLSESDNLAAILSNKADKSDLTKYVTIANKETITGEKNFTGGLKVNGSPIYYDTEKKYWKLEGDLLVTGGVTMYGNEGTYTPSTIMDALLYDDTTLGINSNGQLYVKGGTSGGGLDITALQNYLTQNSYLNVTDGDNRYLKLSGGTLSNTLTISNYNVGLILYRSGKTTPYMRFGENANNEYGEIGVYNDGSLVYWPLVSTQGGYGKWNTVWHEGIFKPSDYLKLKGGKIEDGATGTPLRLNSIGVEVGIGFGINGSYNGWVGYDTIEGTYLYNYATKDKLGIKDDGSLCYTKGTIWHSGNDGSGSGLDADTLDGYHANSSENKPWGTIPVVNSSGWMEVGKQLEFHYDNTTNSDYSTLLKCTGNHSNVVNLPSSSGTIALTTDNVSSATKLQTARTIWGLNFDGTANVSGNITGLSSILGFNSIRNSSDVNQTNGIWVGNVFSSSLVSTDIAYNATKHIFFTGNVGIGVANPSYKLDVATSAKFANIICETDDEINRYGGHLYIQHRGTVEGSQGAARTGNVIMCAQGGNVSIGKASPSYKLDVNGITQSTALKTNSLYFECDSSGNTSDRGGEINRYAGALHLQYTTNKNITLCFGGGSVGVALETPTSKLDVYGVIRSRAYNAIGNNNASFLFDKSGSNYTGIGASGESDTIYFGACNESGAWVNYTQIWKFGGNILTTGGITMYSDQRKKTILNHVELSLKDIANAPLIEHYYNGDDKKTTHVGSIAQYWASMNDWFCKLDSEGYYTMEIQNAALASAISIARELDRYETKTDKDIKKLKKRICELEEEVERLKSE